VKGLERYWWDRNGIALLLWPISWLFCLAVWVRRRAYKLGLRSSTKIPLPVIVVGNITVGGTGKTPLVIWLARHLQQQGLNPGIILRGYGGNANSWPQQVIAGSDPTVVGDEAVLIASSIDCPVCVDPDRVRAGLELAKQGKCDIIISDDGMQHYALKRDIEIAVVDGVRGLGNGFCLPAGPLRERPKRLSQADMVVANGIAGRHQFAMRLRQSFVVNMADSSKVCKLADFANGEPVHAMAGIGHPERFFLQLEGAGLDVIRHEFPDHHRFTSEEIMPDDDAPVLMTEKDAVKCMRFAKPRHWCVLVVAELDDAFVEHLDILIRGLKGG
jgi:tetraacyldisaccharide 4'-kinase